MGINWVLLCIINLYYTNISKHFIDLGRMHFLYLDYHWKERFLGTVRSLATMQNEKRTGC